MSSSVPSPVRSDIRRRQRERAGGSVRRRIGLIAVWTGALLAATAAYQILQGWSSQRDALASLERQGVEKIAAKRKRLPPLPVLSTVSSFLSTASDRPSISEPPPVEPLPRPLIGDLVGRIRIPRANMDLAVFEGVSEDVLRRGPGHVPGTGLPTGGSNCVIAAHRDSFFRPLRRVKVGDLLYLTGETGDERQYRLARSQIVSPEDIGVMAPTPTDQVTLVTCYPFDFIGRAPYRMVMVWQALPEEEKLAEGSPSNNFR